MRKKYIPLVFIGCFGMSGAHADKHANMHMADDPLLAKVQIRRPTTYGGCWVRAPGFDGG
jgi:hypothetical protein